MSKKRFCERCGILEPSGAMKFLAGFGDEEKSQKYMFKEHKDGLFCSECFEEHRQMYKKKNSGAKKK